MVLTNAAHVPGFVQGRFPRLSPRQQEFRLISLTLRGCRLDETDAGRMKRADPAGG